MTSSMRLAERLELDRPLTEGVGHQRRALGGPAAELGRHLAQLHHAQHAPAVGARVTGVVKHGPTLPFARNR